MKKITLYLFLFLSFSLIAQNKSNQNIITNDLTEFMAINSDDELIPINIILTDKYPTSQLYSQIKQLNRADQRALVVNELKSFSKQSQFDLLSYLSVKASKSEVDIVKGLWITNVISCKATEAVINDLSQKDDISRIDYDEIRNMLIGEETGIPVEANSTRGTREITNNVSKVNAPAVWALGYTGQGVVVAVLDVGVNYNHVDLADNMWEHPDYPNHGYDFAYNDDDPMDNHGHGTHCAGTVAGDGTAGSQTGMAPDAKIMALKILDDNGGGSESDSWEAIQFTVDNGGDIMSMSIGWQHSWNPQRATWRNALDNALAAGVIASIAAGNEGEYGSIYNPDDVRTPGDCPPPWLNPDQILQGGISSVVCIGATDANDNIASFSSQGPSTWETINPYNDYPFNPETGLIRPDVSAPGVNIKSCNTFNITGYTTMSGTSMATPGVAGVMALLLSKAPNLSPQAIDIALETTAVDLGTPGKDNVFGAGRVDALEAINNLIEMYAPTSLQANTDQETGLSTLTWYHNSGIGFQYFKIYKNGVEIDTTLNTTYEDQLSDYGYYTYEITAFYDGNNESGAAMRQTQWGSSSIEITPDDFTAIVNPNSSAQQTMIIKNTGLLDLTFSLSPFLRNETLVDWITIEPDYGTVAVGDSMIVTLTFNSEGYDLGLYSGSFIFINNDIEMPNYSVSINMIVDDLELVANVVPAEVCFGDSTQLSANTSGGLGSLAYSWSSIPEGYTSTEPNPYIKPMEDTEYVVSVSDSLITMDASVMVTVFSLPTVDLGENQVLCGESQFDLDAGNPGDTYLWSTDETTQTIVAMGTDETMYWAEVTNTNGCSTIDTVYLNFASIPEIDLGADTAVCGTTNITLNAGNTGSIYSWSNGETSQTIVTDTSGFGYGIQDFSVEVTTEVGCTNSCGISIEFINCTGIDENSSITIKSYPNPTSGIFKIDLKGDVNNPVDISILNASGVAVYSIENINISENYTHNIDIRKFASGIYTVVIYNNAISTTRKIVLRK